jgi:uncharacterized OB-fold protein
MNRKELLLACQEILALPDESTDLVWERATDKIRKALVPYCPECGNKNHTGRELCWYCEEKEFGEKE